MTPRPTTHWSLTGVLHTGDVADCEACREFADRAARRHLVAAVAVRLKEA